MDQYQVTALSSPEIINLQPNEINPFIASCEIRICYTGENRNGSYFSKEVLNDMAKSLRGSPIVGAFDKEQNDFTDHGDRLVISEDGISVESVTIPYGFVSTDADVWFQKFQETDITTGEQKEREYLVTTGFLWAKQFNETQEIFNLGMKGQSMELDPDTIRGQWQQITENKRLFIVTKADFTKLCILGDNVEPCFETAAIIPTTSYNYKEGEQPTNNFTKTLYTMMEELKDVLSKGGEQKMVDEKILKEESDVETAFENKEEKPIEEFKKEDENEKDDTHNNEDDKEDDDKKDDNDDEEKKKKADYTADSNASNVEEFRLVKEQLEEATQKYTALKADFEALTEQYKALAEFQRVVMNEKKDALIQRFYTLSDEDKKDVIENKEKYTLEEIESKLSIIYTRNNLRLEEEKEKEDAMQDITATFSINNQVGDVVPDFIAALRKNKK